MRAIGWVGGLLLFAGASHADDPKPKPKPKLVNLLASVPATVAVSSTVDNAQIVPAHLVDGDLKTAWNSRTGDLTTAWIAFRVPADTQVTSIKLTSGYTHVDPRLGDLFTQNPRIKKVRVVRGGTILGVFALDPESRALQEIPVNAAGGDFTIMVVEIVPGTKKTWLETCVSELEVWRTLAPGVAPKQQKPAVRVTSLDAPPMLSKAECLKAVFPAAKGMRISAAANADTIIATEEIGLSPDVTLCRIDHRQPGAAQITVEVAAVKRATRAVIGKKSIDIQVGPDTGFLSGDNERRDSVEVKPFPLTTTETAVLIAEIQRTIGPMKDDGTNRSTLHRITATGLSALLSFDSTWYGGEADGSDRCYLNAPPPAATLPAELVLDCVKSQSSWHDPDPANNGTKTWKRTETYRWNGSSYAKKSP